MRNAATAATPRRISRFAKAIIALSFRSTIRAADDVHEFLDLPAPIGGVAGARRAFHAMRDVVLQNLLLYATKRGSDGRDLGDDVDAVTVVSDHARESAHLSLDAAEPPQTR